MAEWIDDLARAFGLEPLSDHESGELLRIARDVAHRVERKDTPLAAFLLGMRVAVSARSEAPREERLGAAIAEVDTLLPPNHAGQ
jgi:Domain of unknown function (DUF6457)